MASFPLRCGSTSGKLFQPRSDLSQFLLDQRYRQLVDAGVPGAGDFIQLPVDFRRHAQDQLPGVGLNRSCGILQYFKIRPPCKHYRREQRRFRMYATGVRGTKGMRQRSGVLPAGWFRG